jgi:Cu/Zn superoxide dismutase
MCRAPLLPRIALAAAAMMLAAAAPAAAQSAHATVTASVTVVEPVGADVGRTTVASTRGGIDVTTPLAVRGRAAHVVEVVEDGQATVRSREDARGAVHVRLARADADEPKSLTFVVATIN